MTVPVETIRTGLKLSQQVRASSPTSEEVALFSAKVIPLDSSLPKRSRTFTRIAPGPSSPVIEALRNGCESDALQMLRASPHLLEQGDACGGTPLTWACFLGASRGFVASLLEMGANPFALDHDGYSAVFFAHIEGHKELIRELPPDPSLSFVMNSKILGHFFSLKENIKWRDEIDLPMEFFGFVPLAQEIETILRIFHRLHSPSFFVSKCYEELFFTLKSIQKSQLKLPLFIHLQKKGEAFIYPTGWDGHSIVVVMVEDYLVICDPEHSPTVTITKVDPKQMTQEILDELGKKGNRVTEVEGKEYFYFTLPNKLGSGIQVVSPEERALMTALLQRAPMKQIAAVCCFSSQLEALFVVASFKMLKEHPTVPCTQVIFDVSCEIGRIHLYLQTVFLGKYLQTYRKDENVDRSLMRRLIEHVTFHLPLHFNCKHLFFEHPELPGLTIDGEQYCSLLHSRL